MKVLLVNDLYRRSSAAGVAVHTAEALAASGMEVIFLATVQDPDETRAFEANGVKVTLLYTPPYPIRWRAYRSMNNRSAVRAFEKAASRIEADIIHFHNLHIHFSYASLKRAFKLGRPVVLTVHDVMPFCFQKMFCFVREGLTPGRVMDYRARFWRCLACTRFRFNPFRNRIIRSSISRYAHRVVAVSTPMKEALEQNGIRVHEVIHNGIDLDRWKPPGDGGVCFRERFGLTGSRVILYGGRLEPRLASVLASVSAVSVSSIGTVRCSRMSPSSIPSFSRIVVTPVVVSPLASAHCTGAAPR